VSSSLSLLRSMFLSVHVFCVGFCLISFLFLVSFKRCFVWNLFGLLGSQRFKEPLFMCNWSKWHWHIVQMGFRLTFRKI
jgi:hypothetical protein